MLFAGRGEPAKGLHLALRAWSDSGIGTEARLVICGEIEPRFRAHLGGLLEQPGLEERGYDPDLAPLMRSSDVLLLPSLNEGSALVTYEAQASGCVLAVSDATGAYAEHMVHGLIHEAGDVATLTEHLRDAGARPFLARALPRPARSRTIATHRLSWEAAAGPGRRLRAGARPDRSTAGGRVVRCPVWSIVQCAPPNAPDRL